MNPTLQRSVLEEERSRDEEKFLREYGAQFTENITAWVVPDVLDPCIVRGRTELARVETAIYVVAIDPAFRSCDFALAVLHRTANGSIVVDRVEHWTGTKKAPVPFEWACEKIAEIAKQYGIRKVTGDQHCADIIKQHFNKLGITYSDLSFGTYTRADLFGTLRHLLVQRKIEILDDKTLLKQLRALEERSSPNGSIDIRPAYGQKDDVAVAVALAASELAKRPPKREPHFEVLSIPRHGGPSFGPRQEPGGWTPVGDW
jgi:hypothetical protein